MSLLCNNIFITNGFLHFEYINSGGSRIFERGFLKVGIGISPETFETLEVLRLDFRLFLVTNCNKSNALNKCYIANYREKMVTTSCSFDCSIRVVT